MMHQRLVIAIGLLLLLQVPVAGQHSITVLWDPNPPEDVVVGYRVLRGNAPGVYDTIVDVGPATSLFIEQLPPSTTYYFSAIAYNSERESLRSPEVAFTTDPPPLDPNCTSPLGNRAISIFITNLQLTGSGGPGSRARLDFQIASPNSPVTSIDVRAGAMLVSSMAGSNINDLAGMWFTIPATSGTHPMSVTAINQYGCSRVQLSTNIRVVVP